MSRPYFLNDWSDCKDSDDLIPRCPENGYKPSSGDRPTLLETQRHPMFAWRVRDAVARLRKGEGEISVRERHGRIVVESARREMGADGGARCPPTATIRRFRTVRERRDMKVGISVYCTTCGHEKQPHGRSAPMGLYLCDDNCPGYYADPKPGCLWPGETSEEFGYPHCDNATVEKANPELASEEA